MAPAVRGDVHATVVAECGGVGDGGVAVPEPTDSVRGPAGGGRQRGQGVQPVSSVPLPRRMVRPAGREDPPWPAAGGVRAGGRAAGGRHRRLGRTPARRQDPRQGDLARCGALEPRLLRQGRGLAVAVVAGRRQARLRQTHLGVAVPDAPEPFGAGHARRKRRHQTLPEKATWAMRLVARSGPERQLVMVGDGAYAILDLFWTLLQRAVCVARCRMDARFFNPPPPRKRGQRGRPRAVGTRQLTPRTRVARKTTKWVRMTVPGWRTKDGKAEREVDVATGTALWSAQGKTMPVRWVLTRDPAGRAEPRVFVCSDPAQSALQILTWYAMRWAVEPTFQEARRHLGFETQRQWSDLAIHRTTPVLLGFFSLVTLWAADLARTGKLAVLGAAWYKKPDPTFADCLAAVRRVLWAEEAVTPILWRDDYPTWRARARTAANPRPLQQRMAELMSYAA